MNDQVSDINTSLKKKQIFGNKCSNSIVLCIHIWKLVSFSSYENNIAKIAFLSSVLIISAYLEKINSISRINLKLITCRNHT